MNDSTLINLEIQVANEGNWPERSLSYLCRSFDNLNEGEHYDNLKPAIYIGIPNFTLFPAHPEFHSSYLLMNEKKYTIYSDKLRLSVLNLPQIHLATETDSVHQLDHWAALFQATTWEDIKMIASKNDTMQEAAETMYRLSQNEKIRLQCEARERYYRDQRTHQYQLEKIKKMGEIEEKLKVIEGKLVITEGKLEAAEGKLEAAIAELQQRDNTIRKKDSLLHETLSELEKLRSELAALQTGTTT